MLPISDLLLLTDTRLVLPPKGERARSTLRSDDARHLFGDRQRCCQAGRTTAVCTRPRPASSFVWSPSSLETGWYALRSPVCNLRLQRWPSNRRFPEEPGKRSLALVRSVHLREKHCIDRPMCG